MNWYKLADKSIRDIAWDPNPKDTQDNWDVRMKDSDLNALMLKMYQLGVGPENVDEEDVDEAFLDLKEKSGDLGMWKYIERHQPDYLEDLRIKAEKGYTKFYNDLKAGEEGQILFRIKYKTQNRS
jgi:hypothetical protein